MISPGRRLIPLSCALALTAFDAHAFAQSPADQMLAQSLFDEGRSLMEQKRYADACPKLAESQRLDPGGGTLLNLAICHELEGRLATAFVELNTALSQARKDGRQDRIDIAAPQLAALGARVPRLTIRIAREYEAEPGLEITLDGTPIRRPAWNVSTIVDPGPHIVEARAPARPTPFRMTIDVRERDQRVVDIAFGSARSPLPAASASGAGASAERAAPSGRRNPVYSAAIGTGVGGLALGAIAAVAWTISSGERRRQCAEERSFCTPDGLAAADRERAFGWTAIIAASVGAAGFIVAASVPKVVFVSASLTGGSAAVSLNASF